MTSSQNRSCLAFSGGETSALAALLLLHEGDHLSACHFFIEPNGRFPVPPGFSTAEDRERMAKYAAQNEIPLEFIDVTAQFEDKVLDATIHARISALRDQSYYLWVTKVFVPEWVKFAESKRCNQLVSGHHAFLAKPLGKALAVIERIPDSDRDDSALLLALPEIWRGRVRLPVAELPALMIKKFKEEARLPDLTTHTDVRRGSLYPFEAWADNTWLKNYVPEEFLKPGVYQGLNQFVDKTHNGIYSLQVGDLVPEASAEEGDLYVLAMNQVNQAVIVGTKQYLDQNRFIGCGANFEIKIDPLLPTWELQVALFDHPAHSVPCRLTAFAHGFFDLETGIALSSVEQGQILVFFNKNTPIGSMKVERVIHSAAAEFEKLQSRTT